MKRRIKLDSPEFSYPLVVEKIPAAGLKELLDADAVARQKLAARFALLDLPLLRANLTVDVVPISKTIVVKGRMIADVVQACVVTLEPIVSHIEQDISAFYALTKTTKGDAELEALDADDDEMESVENGEIDLGELIAQNLGVAIDPWPRKKGAVLPAPPSEAPVVVNPFAGLLKGVKKPANEEG